MKRRFWADEEEALLVRDYPDTRTDELARRLGRSERAVYGRAFDLGLKKSPSYLASPAAHRFDGAKGGGTRFKPGHKTWNKGRRGWKAGGRAEKTRFKHGNRPVNWRPIGSLRVSHDGYLQKKVTDTGRTTDWVGVQVLIWQRKNGSVPKGHIVIFRDGDKTNLNIDNLEMISRAENIERNGIHNYPPELKYVMRLHAKLRREIEERI